MGNPGSCCESGHRHPGVRRRSAADGDVSHTTPCSGICPYTSRGRCRLPVLPRAVRAAAHTPWHVVQAGGTEERRTLAFRDYLREHQDVSREYEALKWKSRCDRSRRIQDLAYRRARPVDVMARFVAAALAAGYPPSALSEGAEMRRRAVPAVSLFSVSARSPAALAAGQGRIGKDAGYLRRRRGGREPTRSCRPPENPC